MGETASFGDLFALATEGIRTGSFPLPYVVVLLISAAGFLGLIYFIWTRPTWARLAVGVVLALAWIIASRVAMNYAWPVIPYAEFLFLVLYVMGHLAGGAYLLFGLPTVMMRRRAVD